MNWNTCPSAKELTRSFSEADEAVKEHVESCRDCAEEWASFERLRKLGGELPDGVPTPERAEDVRCALLAMTAGSTAKRKPQYRTARLYGAVAASIALAITAYFILSLAERTTEPEIASEVHRAVVVPEKGAEHEIVDSQPDEIVRLSQGTINLEVKKLEPGERFRVVTRDAEVEVRGTAFAVTAKDDHLISVVVASGRVEVRPTGYAMVVLGAGESWTRPEPEAPAPVDESQMEAEAIAEEETKAETKAEARTERPGRIKRDTAALTASGTEREGEPEQDVGDEPERKIVKGPAETAFNRGWEALRSGTPMEAADWFGRSIAAAGSNRIAEDASYWMAVAYGRAGAKGQAIEALRAFLASYPGSPRVGEASAMLGWKLFDKGDLDAAESLFKSALRDSVPRVAKSAQKGLSDIAGRREQKADE